VSPQAADLFALEASDLSLVPDVGQLTDSVITSVVDEACGEILAREVGDVGGRVPCRGRATTEFCQGGARCLLTRAEI
jgi:hypothetical protein